MTASAAAELAALPGWSVHRLPTGHDVRRDAPDRAVALLAGLIDSVTDDPPRLRRRRAPSSPRRSNSGLRRAVEREASFPAVLPSTPYEHVRGRAARYGPRMSQDERMSQDQPRVGGGAGPDRATPGLSKLGRGLWQARLVITVASLACMLLALGALWMTLVDLWRFFSTLVDYNGLQGAAAATARTELITDIVKVLDGFLLCAILVIASLGIFELFVGPVGGGEQRAQLLQVHDLDDLKERVARLVLLILMIELFGYALRIPYKTPQELLMLAGAVLLVALSIFLTTNRSVRSETVDAPPE